MSVEKVLVKQLKNRYNSASTNRKFIIGIDRPKMKLSDIVMKIKKSCLTQINMTLVWLEMDLISVQRSLKKKQRVVGKYDVLIY